MAFGGRVTDEIMFGHDEVSTGAMGDFRQATLMATRMITLYGMDRVIGSMSLDFDHQQLSPNLRFMIESRIRLALKTGELNARSILVHHSVKHHEFAQALLQHQTLSKRQIDNLFLRRYLIDHGSVECAS